WLTTNVLYHEKAERGCEPWCKRTSGFTPPFALRSPVALLVAERPGAVGQLDLIPQIAQPQLQLPVLERWVRALAGLALGMNDLRLVQILLKILRLLHGQLQLVLLRRRDAPLVLVAALGAVLVEVPPARPPEGRCRQLDLAAGKRHHVLHRPL